DLSAQFLALAEKHGATGPRLIAHRIMGISLATTGDIATGRAHFDRALALYGSAEHRALATRFSVDAAMSILSYRSWTIWAVYRTENNSKGSSGGSPSASACSINMRARSAAALVSGAAYPLIWSRGVMSATCSSISSLRSVVVVGKFAIWSRARLNCSAAS